MNEFNEGNGKAILIAAITGAAVGAGVALLFAPCSGKETRTWLADRTSQLKEKTTRAYEQSMEAIRHKAKELGKDVAKAQDGDVYARPNTPPMRG